MCLGARIGDLQGPRGHVIPTRRRVWHTYVHPSVIIELAINLTWDTAGVTRISDDQNLLFRVNVILVGDAWASLGRGH